MVHGDAKGIHIVRNVSTHAANNVASGQCDSKGIKNVRVSGSYTEQTRNRPTSGRGEAKMEEEDEHLTLGCLFGILGLVGSTPKRQHTYRNLGCPI
jgi:hypothetical protein